MDHHGAVVGEPVPNVNRVAARFLKVEPAQDAVLIVGVLGVPGTLAATDDLVRVPVDDRDIDALVVWEVVLLFEVLARQGVVRCHLGREPRPSWRRKRHFLPGRLHPLRKVIRIGEVTPTARHRGRHLDLGVPCPERNEPEVGRFGPRAHPRDVLAERECQVPTRAHLKQPLLELGLVRDEKPLAHPVPVGRHLDPLPGPIVREEGLVVHGVGRPLHVVRRVGVRALKEGQLLAQPVQDVRPAGLGPRIVHLATERSNKLFAKSFCV